MSSCGRDSLLKMIVLKLENICDISTIEIYVCCAQLKKDIENYNNTTPRTDNF